MEPIISAVEKAERKVALLDPIDHRNRIEHFMFDIIDPEEARVKYALVPLMPDNGPTALTGKPLMLSPHAMRQLCERLHMPIKFVRRLESMKAHKLLGINLNMLMQHGKTGMAMFRTINSQNGETARTVRAVLGSQYQPLDDLDLLTVAAPYLEGAEIAFSSFDDMGTHITAIWPEEVNATGLMRGVHIANSEVGLRAISIEAVAYRPKCANILPALGLGGMGDGEQAMGGGRPIYRSRNRAFTGDATYGWRLIHRGDTNRLQAFVADAIADVSRQYEGVVARWQQGLTEMIDDPIGALSEIADAKQLTVDQYKASLTAWAETRPDFGDCRTGLVNAFTLAAQNEENADDRYAMQIAGTYALSGYTIHSN